MIRLTIPAIDDAEISAVTEVLRSGYLVQGPRVEAFERAVAERVGVSHAVAVSSGTAALHLALLSLGVGSSDLVVTTVYSWPATANVVELCGATPIFVDIDPATFNLEPNQLETTCRELFADRATAGAVKAILPVHAFGHPADMTAVMEIAGRYELPVVEDAACALGATWNGRPAGSIGRLGCFSFHPRKAITTGEGGMITTDNDGLAKRLRVLRNHGLDPMASDADFVEAGFNYRMTELGGAMGKVQLGKLDQLIDTRRQKAATYHRLLENTAIRAPLEAMGAASVYQSYVVQIPERVGEDQRQVIGQLRERGIEATIGTYHIPLTTFYSQKYGFSVADFPHADSVTRTAVTIPLHQHLEQDEQTQIVDTMLDLLDERKQ